MGASNEPRRPISSPRDEARRIAANIAKLPEAAARFAAVKRGVTRSRRHTYDVRAMSACVPTADVSLHRGEQPLSLCVTNNKNVLGSFKGEFRRGIPMTHRRCP